MSARRSCVWALASIKVLRLSPGAGPSPEPERRSEGSKPSAWTRPFTLRAAGPSRAVGARSRLTAQAPGEPLTVTVTCPPTQTLSRLNRSYQVTKRRKNGRRFVLDFVNHSVSFEPYYTEARRVQQ